MGRRLLSVFFVLLVGLSVGAPCELARAWEFNMEGIFTSTYEYYSVQGSSGFFGPANMDRSAGTAGSLGLKPGDFASLNGWVGKRARDLVSGDDSSQQYPVLYIYPEVRINPAIRFRGEYRLGDYGDPAASDYITNTRPGLNVATSDGQWTLWWVTAQVPLGTLVVGKRPEEFGCGIHYDGTHALTGEGVLLVSNYGPMRIGLAVQPFWQSCTDSVPGVTQYLYYNLFDKSGLRAQSTKAFLTYRAGALDIGTQTIIFRWHTGPEALNTEAARAAVVPYDRVIQHGDVYLKYFNGRVFLNTELAYLTEAVYQIGKGPSYTESWRYMLETGAVAGPAKLSALYAFMPGADRRHGALIHKQPYVQRGLITAYGIFQPYSYLLAYAYGSGVNAFDLSRNGYINEAWVLAARLDYSMAANLNLFGSFLWAERTSHGHGWGFIRPAQKAAVTRVVNSAGAGADQVQWTPYVNYADNTGAPSIPDNGLGWEVTAGLNWNLLEKYQLFVLAAFWKPGKWFNYACIDRSVANWDVPTAANRWGTYPDRTIDPVFGAQVIVTTEF